MSSRLRPWKSISRPSGEAQLSEIASQAGIDPEHLVKKTALSLRERDVRFRATVYKGLEQADRGEFVGEGEISRIEGMMQA